MSTSQFRLFVAFGALFASAFLFAPHKTKAYVNISEETIWKLTDSPIIVTEATGIGSGGKLTIEPGVVVKFNPGTYLITGEGFLEARGTADAPIVFTSLSDDNSSAWEGIYLYNQSDVLSSVQIRYATNSNCLTLGALATTFSKIRVEHCYNGVSLINGFSGVLENIEVAFNQRGIVDNDANGAMLRYNKIHDNQFGVFINTYYPITVVNNEITKNAEGVLIGRGGAANVTFDHNNVYDNTYWAVDNGSTIVLNAVNNWWGSTSGPYQWQTNKSGTGNAVTNYVLYEPWLNSPVKIGTKRPVLIIPGIEGTSLYFNKNLSWIDLNRIRQTDDKFLLEELGMTELGTSLNEIEVGGVITRINFSLLGFNFVDIHIFDRLISELTNEGYSLNQDLFFFPYDWRFDLDTRLGLLDETILTLKTTTGSDNIDIIAHSMGGLLAENYISLYGKSNINKLIFVGTPHLGAPIAGKTLLFGDNLSNPYLDMGVVKNLAVNMPSIYELLPSRQYFEKSYGYIAPYKFPFSKELLNYDDTKNWLKNKALNQSLIDKSDTFSSRNLNSQNYSGVQAYNIAGCHIPTQSAYKFSFYGPISQIGYSTGDETVPLVSAEAIQIDPTHKFYSRNTKHLELPSNLAVIDLIAHILSDTANTLSENISNSRDFCSFKGKTLTWRSPVAVDVYDSTGNHSGPIDGGLENNIPGVDYEIIDGEKFIFLPTDDGQQYTVSGQGEAAGTFDLLISENEDGLIQNTIVYNDVPVIPETTINLNISDTSTDNEIAYNFDGAGEIDPLYSSAILSGEANGDLTPPVTNYQFTGLLGENGWYRGPVTVSLNSEDDNSGILETKYSVDGGATFFTYSGPFTIENNGIHQLMYRSIDKAGNDEEMQQLEIKLDSTPPEFAAVYDAVIDDFKIFGIDNLDVNPSIEFVDQGSIIKDKAGNSTGVAYSKILPNKLQVQYVAYDLVNPLAVAYNYLRIEGDTQIVLSEEKTVTATYYPSYDATLITTKIGDQKTQVVEAGRKILQMETNKGKINTEIK